MFKQWLISVAVLLALLAAWLFVRHIARRYAERHPEFGPFRETGGCGGSQCDGQGGCGAASCQHADDESQAAGEEKQR